MSSRAGLGPELSEHQPAIFRVSGRRDLRYPGGGGRVRQSPAGSSAGFCAAQKNS